MMFIIVCYKEQKNRAEKDKQRKYKCCTFITLFIQDFSNCEVSIIYSFGMK